MIDALKNVFSRSGVIIILCLVLLLSFDMAAQEYVQDQSRTEVKFRVKNMGISVNGTFEKSEFVVSFDESSLTESSVKVKIHIESIDTGNSKRDKDLKKKKYFDLEKYPYLEFNSTSFKKNDQGQVSMVGNLKIKDVEKEVEIPLAVKEEEGGITLSTVYELNRRDFKVGGKSFTMSDTVEIDVSFHGIK